MEYLYLAASLSLAQPDSRPAADVLNEIETNIKVATPMLSEQSRCRIQALRATTFSMTLAAHTQNLSQAMEAWVSDGPSDAELTKRIATWRSYIAMVLAVGRTTQTEMKAALLRCAYNKVLKPKLDDAAAATARRIKTIQDVWARVEKP